MNELYRLIQAEKANHPIVLLCRVLKVARSSYYAWCEGEAARRVRQAADCAYGDQDSFRRQLDSAGLPFVMALKPSHGTWAYGKDAYTPVDAAHALTWTDPEHPGDWTAVERTFRD
ncbi:hypothetical protein ACFTXM_45630, partial [Streptomyces sp. NPDC056930]